MIPRKVFETVAYGFNICRGASMTKDGWTYDLGHKLSKVNCVKSRVVKKVTDARTCYTDLSGKITEYQDCRLSDIPDSVDSDWRVWDEY